MKKTLLLLLLAGSFSADAQSLKEALYGGKLKAQHGMVIRKGDDLSKFIDTSSRKTAVDNSSQQNTAAVKPEAPLNTTTAQPGTATSQTDSAAMVANNSATATTGTTAENNSAPENTTAGNPATDTAAVATETEEATEAPVVKEKPKNNRALFKEYMTSLASTLKSEFLSNKKIKKGSYFVNITYTIGTDGQVTITDLYVDPKQELLQQQIKERLEQDPPKLNPELNSAGVARKVNRNYSFTIDKE